MSYRKVSSDWISGRVGRSLRGDSDAYVLAYYLMTAKENIKGLGLFWQPIECIGVLFGISLETVTDAYRKLSELDFAWYDIDSEWHFVRESARHEWGEVPKGSEKQIAGLRSTLFMQLEAGRESLAFGQWITRYGNPWRTVLEPLANSSGRLAKAYRNYLDSPEPDPDPETDPEPDPEEERLARARKATSEQEADDERQDLKEDSSGDPERDGHPPLPEEPQGGSAESAKPPPAAAAASRGAQEESGGQGQGPGGRAGTTPGRVPRGRPEPRSPAGVHSGVSAESQGGEGDVQAHRSASQAGSQEIRGGGEGDAEGSLAGLSDKLLGITERTNLSAEDMRLLTRAIDGGITEVEIIWAARLLKKKISGREIQHPISYLAEGRRPAFERMRGFEMFGRAWGTYWRKEPAAAKAWFEEYDVRLEFEKGRPNAVVGRALVHKNSGAWDGDWAPDPHKWISDHQWKDEPRKPKARGKQVEAGPKYQLLVGGDGR